MCSAFFPTILGSFQEELKGWGRRTWATTGLSYNPVLTPTRAAPVLLSSPHHITKSEERGLLHLSLSKSDSSDRSLEILWFWNIKVCPKWDLPGDILIRVNQHDFLPRPSIDRFLIIVSQLKPTCACLLGNIFRNPCVFHSGKFIWGNTWGCELRGWQKQLAGTMSWAHSISHRDHRHRMFIRSACLLIHKHLQLGNKWL